MRQQIAVDQVRGPDPKGVPSSAPPAWARTRAMTAQISGRGCDDGGFSLLYLNENGPTAAAGLDVPQRPMRPASLAGRWSGVTAG